MPILLDGAEYPWVAPLPFRLRQDEQGECSARGDRRENGQDRLRGRVGR